MEEKTLSVILKDGTDVSKKSKENGEFLLVSYDEKVEKPNEYFSEITINSVKYESVSVFKVYLEKDGEYFAIDYLGE